MRLAALAALVAFPALAGTSSARAQEPSAPRTQQLAAELAASRPSAQPIARPQRSAEHARAIADWRELDELGLWNAVIEAGLPLVQFGGPLERDSEAAALVARALVARGRGAETAALLAPERYPEPERGWTEIERARLALERDDHDAVYAILTSASTAEGRSVQIKHANFPESWLLAARAYARDGEAGKAGKLAQRFLELDPLHPDVAIAWHLLSEAARARGDQPGAERYAVIEQEARGWRAYLDARRRQIREQPREPLPRLGLASCWMQVRDYAKARAVLDELVALAPEFCRGWFHLGEARRLTGDASGARAAWTKALECDPTDLKSRYNRGLLAWLELDWAAAETDLLPLLETKAAEDPKLIGIHLFAARNALRNGESKAAEDAYAKYKALGGTEPLVKRD
ncbi:MAG: hypothetical protein EPO68_13930 [Planctomycetota bacterium]|nr:MAG: hypothetical protein EPO68_13930 [Planctomycetota bacterium]